MEEKLEHELEQFMNHIKAAHQTWLLGAGISREAGIPLMVPLTKKVAQNLQGDVRTTFNEILAALRDNSHVEHVLSQIGDLIALAERTKDGKAELNGKTYDKAQLHNLHGQILREIGHIIRCGHKPSPDDDATKEQNGTLDKPIVSVDDHRKFIKALFGKIRANLESIRPHVSFFTTNYDTLLEDALALERIDSADCFTGGAMGYWDATVYSRGTRAHVYKLHGSIDWYLDKQSKSVFRYRDGSGYPPRDIGRLLIYPQATKYVETQKDPFAHLFGCFRSALSNSCDNTLIICGYSFGDDHINGEIEIALNAEKNKTNLVIFTFEETGLPDVLKKWLSSDWKQRIFVATNKGFYRGSIENAYPADHKWWTFQGITDLLENGLAPMEGEDA